MKPSRNIAIHTDNPEEAKNFYRSLMQLPQNPNESSKIPFGDARVFIDPPLLDDSGNKIIGPIFELLVDDVDVARSELIAKGCQVILWEGSPGCCYVEDPFGVKFNLFQSPS